MTTEDFKKGADTVSLINEMFYTIQYAQSIEESLFYAECFKKMFNEVIDKIIEDRKECLK